MIRKVLFAGAVLILNVCFQTSAKGLECLSCTGASHISDCLSDRVKCDGYLQTCFLKIFLKPDGHKVINAGCGLSIMCLGDSVLGKRSVLKRRGTGINGCFDCCDKLPDATTNIPCNAYLCNQVPTRNTCVVCNNTSNYNFCESQVCPSDEEMKKYIRGLEDK